jgi:hypothetical protein
MPTRELGREPPRAARGRLRLGSAGGDDPNGIGGSVGEPGGRSENITPPSQR